MYLFISPLPVWQQLLVDLAELSLLTFVVTLQREPSRWQTVVISLEF